MNSLPKQAPLAAKSAKKTSAAQAQNIAPLLTEDILHRLIRLENRLDQLSEDRTARAPVRGRLTDMARRAIGPRLWTYQQYRPRMLKTRWQSMPLRASELWPSIAIVTPSYNHASFIPATANSVLRQGYPKLSYHVQDGGSTDGTKEILQRFDERVPWRSEPDDGQADAINKGFASLKGDIMGWLNSDDMLMPGTLAHVAEFFVANPQIDVVFGNRIYVDRDGFDIGRCILPGHDGETIKWCDYIPQETMFWRRQVWEAVGGLRTSFQYALDWDFILRAARLGFRFHHVPRFLGCFRVHDSQKSTSLADLGRTEMQRLRLEHLGFEPSQADVSMAIRPYLIRHVLADRLYRVTGMQMRIPPVERRQ
jgi:hypothetical protein